LAPGEEDYDGAQGAPGFREQNSEGLTTIDFLGHLFYESQLLLQEESIV